MARASFLSARLLVVASFAASGAALATTAVSSTVLACGGATYSTRGVVKSFGKDRAYVNIAHERIAGYMEAMTMSFEPKDAEQLRSVEVGDQLAFTFTATDEGRRVLQAVTKVPTRARR